MDRHYDLTYLNQVFYGNETMVQEIVELFLMQGPKFMQDMTECVRQAKWAELHPVAHKLKSSVNMLGMSGLLPLVLDIERTSKFEENPTQLPQLVSELTVLMDSVCLVVQKDLNEARTHDSGASTQLRRA